MIIPNIPLTRKRLHPAPANAIYNLNLINRLCANCIITALLHYEDKLFQDEKGPAHFRTGLLAIHF